MTGRELDADAELLAELTKLNLRWSSAEFQRRVVAAVGLDLDDTAVRAIYVIGLLGEAQVSVIADELHLTRPTASKLVSRLERACLIRRSPGARDARVRNVSLTGPGCDAFALLVDAGIQMVRTATAGWPKEDRRRFAALLDGFVERLVGEPAVALPGADAVSPNRAEMPPSGKEE